MAPSRQPSLFAQLRMLDKQLVPIPCPACGNNASSPIMQRDRYFLRVALSTCDHCGLVHVARGLQGDVQADFYAHLYPRLMKQPPAAADLGHYRLIAGYRYSEISTALGSLESVLDIGAGLGFFLDACQAHGCRQFLGLEPGAPQRDYATHSLGLGDNVRAEELTEHTTLPFAPRLVTMFHVLEHLESPGEALRAIARLMDREGWLVLEVPDIEADWRSLGLWQIRVSHRSYFSEYSLASLLAAHGFRAEIVQREASGIYCGNLRIYARRDEAPGMPPDNGMSPPRLREHIRSQITASSFSNGYPRAAMRLAKLALTPAR